MATVVVDEANRIVEWNTAACLLLGYEREEALGREVGALIACAGRLLELQEWFAGLRQLEHAAARTPFETRVQRANGEQVPVRIEATRTMTTPPFFVVTLRDLRIGEMVDLNHPCVVALVNASTDAVAILSPDGLVLSWNRAAEELYGYQAGEALGQRLASLIVPAELMHEPDRWLGEVRSGRVVEAESRRLRKDRREVLVSVRLTPVRGSRRSVVAVVMIARDVTASRLYPDRHSRDRRTAFWQRQIDAAIRSDAFAFAAQPVVDLRGGAIDHYELMLRMRTRERLLRPRTSFPRPSRLARSGRSTSGPCATAWSWRASIASRSTSRRSAWQATRASPSWTRACSASDSMRRA